MSNKLIKFEKYNKTPPLTDWLKRINYPDFEEFNKEDNTKFDRLDTLRKTINLMYDAPETIEAENVVKNHPNFREIMKRRANELCAVRLTPHVLTKTRIHARGLTLKEYTKTWLPSQKINFEDYKLDIIPQNTSMIYSAIFLVNDYGIIGEITKGIHWHLTQGMCEKDFVIFYFNFENWLFSVMNEDSKIDHGQKILKQALEMIRVTNKNKREQLKKTLKAEFTEDNYLKGYFEFFVTPQKTILYNDYNRLIYHKLKNFRLQINNTQALVKGITVSPGEARGQAKIIKDPKTANIKNGDIIICKKITIDYLPLIKKAGAIISEQGSLLSHFTIIAREMKKPYLVNAINAIKKIPDNSKIILDGDSGSVYFI